MKKQIVTLLWFLSRPQYIPQIFQVLKRKHFQEKENTANEAKKWATENALSKEQVIQQVCHQETVLTHPEQTYQAIYQHALQQQATCPVTMGGEGAIDVLYTICRFHQPEKIIETGVAYGWSSLAILLAIKDNPRARLISNDMPYIKMNNDDFVGCIIANELKSKWELQRLPDVKGIPLALKKFQHSIDICHYDSDKSYTGRMFAYPLLWNALKKNGIFISDDIQDNIAFKEFAEKVNRTPIILEHLGKYVGIIIK